VALLGAIAMVVSGVVTLDGAVRSMDNLMAGKSPGQCSTGGRP
jgi:hypothetical protein